MYVAHRFPETWYHDGDMSITCMTVEGDAVVRHDIREFLFLGRVVFVYDSRWEAKLIISRVCAQTSQGPTKVNRHCPTSCWGDLKGS
jgi:hypothetical protein